MSELDPFALGGHASASSSAEPDEEFTTEQLAETDIEPWPPDLLGEFDHVPWRETCASYGVACRIAVRMMMKTKSELVEVVRALGDGDGSVFTETLDFLMSASDGFKGLYEMTSAAQARLMIAAAAVVVAESANPVAEPPEIT